MAIARCQSCSRSIAARWRRCPWCKRWTGQPHRVDGELLDAELQALAAVSTAMGIAVTFFGLAFVDGQQAVAAACSALGLALVASGVGSLLSARSIDVALGAWCTLLGIAVWSGGLSLAALLPGLVTLFVGVRRQKLRAHLRCDQAVVGWRPAPGLDLTRCEICHQPARGLIAPRLSLSFGFAALLVHTSFRVRCLRHARIRAIPATVISALFGWWSVMGLFWTPTALIDNLTEGGVHANDAGVQSAEREALLGWRTSLPALGAIGGGVVGLLEGAYIANQLSKVLG